MGLILPGLLIGYFDDTKCLNSTIKVNKSTKDKLSKLGTVASTYDSVLNELIDHATKCDHYWEDKCI